MNRDTETSKARRVLIAYAEDLPNMHTPDISENHKAEIIAAIWVAVGFIE